MSKSPAITVRSALPTLFSWQNGLCLASIQWELAGLGLPMATIADLRAVGAFQTGCTQDWRLESVNIHTHMDRGSKLCDLSYSFKAACPEWRVARSALIRGWIMQDILSAK